MSATSGELKSKLLDMFVWFHTVCVENNLRYYMLGGTMLGAVRHSGFIPWDDDVDVGMPRKDYERLVELLEGKLTGGYILETHQSGAEDFVYPFGKIYDVSTTLVENARHKIKRGIYIDVFPLDGIGDSKDNSIQNYKAVEWRLNLLQMRVGGIRKGRKLYKNLAVLLMRMVPNCILSNKKLLSSAVRICCRYKYDDSEWVGNLTGAWRQRELMPRSVLGTPVLYAFEGYEFYGAQDADAYLTYLYGDWRQLPPEEKRISHHDFLILDMEKSYLL